MLSGDPDPSINNDDGSGAKGRDVICSQNRLALIGPCPSLSPPISAREISSAPHSQLGLHFLELPAKRPATTHSTTLELDVSVSAQFCG